MGMDVEESKRRKAGLAKGRTRAENVLLCAGALNGPLSEARRGGTWPRLSRDKPCDYRKRNNAATPSTTLYRVYCSIRTRWRTPWPAPKTAPIT